MNQIYVNRTYVNQKVIVLMKKIQISLQNIGSPRLQSPFQSLRIFLITCVTASLSASGFLVIQAFITLFTYGVSTTSL
jgi:hypothetical protein